MAEGPITPTLHLPWLRWLDRSELPASVIAAIMFLLYLPFYEYQALTPQLPLEGGAFPPACALTLMFYLVLTRGSANDLVSLIRAGKINSYHLESLAPAKGIAGAELLIGLVIGFERVHSQILFSNSGEFSLSALMSPSAFIVACTIVIYTVLQIHLFAFCLRQAFVFRKVARDYNIDLLTPELNSALANPLIRFFALGLVGVSFGVVIYELVPYASLQRRVLEATLIAGFIWLVLLLIAISPLFILRTRIALAKKMEIDLIRRALRGDLADAMRSQFGERLKRFSPADLMYYEDRITGIWEWPFQAQVRRIVIFGLLPPLTWVLAALVEIIFETFLIG